MINKENNFEKGINVLHKEQIIIDGVEYNPCNGCKLWNGHHCIGARSYEPNADKHRAICNEHMAKQFYIVYQQLYRKTQECEQIKEKYEALKLENQEGYEIVAELKHECEELKKEIINKNEKIKELRLSVSDLTNRLCYLNAEKSFRIVDLEQALDEIAAHYQKVIKNITNYDDSYDASISIKALHNISDIIKKAKGE